MKRMAISVFRAHALHVVAQVAATKEGVILTKRGKPVAEVVPFRQPAATSRPGKLAHTLHFEKDIVSPLSEVKWEANRY